MKDICSLTPCRFSLLKEKFIYYTLNHCVNNNKKIQTTNINVFTPFATSLANKQDQESALDEVDIMEQLDLENIVNINKCPCRIVRNMMLYYASNTSDYCHKKIKKKFLEIMRVSQRHVHLLEIRIILKD